MRTRRTAPTKLVIYALALVAGLLAGPIVTAARLYAEFGWTATWVEINNWKPEIGPQPVSVKRGRPGFA